MRARKTQSARQLLVWLALLAAVLFLLGFVQLPERAAFVSSEIAFTDPSVSGLGIMSASCSSSPSYYHSNLSATADGLGYVSSGGGGGSTERGAYRNSVYICITNTTGADVFVPANTASEMNTMKTNVGSGGTYLKVW